MRPPVRVLPLFATAAVCAAAGLGVAYLIFGGDPTFSEAGPASVAPSPSPSPLTYERELVRVHETLSIADGQSRSYAVSIGTHVVRISSAPRGLVLGFGKHVRCTEPLPNFARTWFETRCTLRTRDFLTVTNPSDGPGGSAEQSTIYLSTVLTRQ